MLEYKTISFRVDETTYNRLQEHTKGKYITLSAYIRMCVDLQLDKEDIENELQRTTQDC